MNRNFRIKFDETADNNFKESKATEHSNLGLYNNSYEHKGHGRNICFILLNGNRIFLGYNYLVSGEYVQETNTITLIFSSHEIVLEGVNLEPLYYEIMDQQCRQIVSKDARYNLIGEEEEPMVNTIRISAKEK